MPLHTITRLYNDAKLALMVWGLAGGPLPVEIRRYATALNWPIGTTLEKLWWDLYAEPLPIMVSQA